VLSSFRSSVFHVTCSFVIFSPLNSLSSSSIINGNLMKGSHVVMSLNNNLDHDELTRTLTESFKILADEVQLLNDRNLILEHKLRFARDSVSRSFFLCIPVSHMMKNLALDLELLSAATTDKPHMYISELLRTN